jgi:hypothetical protein
MCPHIKKSYLNQGQKGRGGGRKRREGEDEEGRGGKERTMIRTRERFVI